MPNSCEAKADLRSLLPGELAQALAQLRLPGYRAKQIFRWLQGRGVPAADDMTDLPAQLRQTLDEQFLISRCTAVKQQVSRDGSVKFLFELHDGEQIESVVMRYRYGLSICISTQVGCRMGCVFCASGQGGCARSLAAGEMIAQVHTAQRMLGEPITHAVLMGMGEPLDNYDSVLRFIRLAGHPEGLHLGQRRISLSTSGLVPRIDQLAQEHLGVTLSISLHAPDDATRTRLMPINKTYPIAALLASCKRYSEATGRRVSYEYALFAGVNDSETQALQLARLLRGTLCHVNLIPANETCGALRPSAPASVCAFQQTLERRQIAVTVRRSLGKDIAGACGQLRLQTLDVRP